MSYLLTNKALSDFLELGSVFQPLVPSVTDKTGDTVRFNETSEGHTVEIDLPGVKKADCSIELFQQGVNVRVYVKASRKLTHRGGTRDETFTREFTLREVNEHKVNANLEDGVLTITAPIEVNRGKRKVLELK